MLGIALGLASLLFALVFVIVAVTKIGSGYWFGYVSILLCGAGAVGCFMAARQCFVRDRRSVPNVLGIALGLASALFVVLAVAAVVSVQTDKAYRSSVYARSVEYVFIVLFVLGAIGCFMAARQCFARDRRDAVQAMVVEPPRSS